MKADYVHKDSLTSTDSELSFKMSDEEIKKLMNLLTQGGLRHFVLKLDDEELDVVEYKEYKKLEERIAYLERSIERKDDTIIELELERVPYTNEYVEKLEKENKELKSQLKGTTHCYDEAEHRQLKEQLSSNTLQLENQQKEFIKYLEDEINKTDYEVNILGNYPYLAWSNACKKNLQKYKSIIGVEVNGQ